MRNGSTRRRYPAEDNLVPFEHIGSRYTSPVSCVRRSLKGGVR